MFSEEIDRLIILVVPLWVRDFYLVAVVELYGKT